jgi:hypothetical protein
MRRAAIPLTPEAIEVEELTKVATREERIHQLEPSAYKLNTEQLEAIPSFGEKDVYRTLQLLPGVVVTNDYKSQLYVRGGNSDQNLVLLDGGIMYNPFHFSGILSAFDVDAVDNVGFYAGGFGAQYGGRLSSVLDITTRRGASRFSGRMAVSPVSGKLLLEWPFRSWGNFLISARRSYVSHAAKELGDQVEPDFYDGIARLDLRLSANDQIAISGFLGDDKVQLQESEADELLTSENFTGAFNYKRTFSQRLQTTLNASYGRFHSTTPPPSGFDKAHTNTLKDFSGNFSVEYQLNPRIRLDAGMHYRNINIFYNSFDPVLSELLIDERLNELAFYLQSSWEASVRWILDAGVRVNRYAAGQSFLFEPRLNARYRLNDVITLKGAYGRFSQNLVTIYNENDTYNPVEIWLPPEAHMNPATSDHIILGMSYEGERMAITAETYFKNYGNLTHFNRERLDPVDPYFVQGEGYSLGFDLSARWVSRHWRLWANYSLGKAQKELPHQYPTPGIDTFAPRYDRRHNLNLSVDYRPTESWQFSSRYTLASGLPFSFMIGAYERQSSWYINRTSDYVTHDPEEPRSYLTAIQSERDAFRFPWYHRLDVSIKYHKKTKYFTITPYVLVINTYDQPNVLYYDIQAQPYTSVPFLPMVGVEVMF